MARLFDKAAIFIAWARKRRRVSAGDTPVKVNLGSGLTVAPGWINVDASLNALVSGFPSFVLNRLYDWSDNRQWYSRSEYISILKSHRFVHHRLEYGVPFEDETVDVIYSSHVLEHMFREEAERLLRDAFRALRRDGLIRIAVPDVEHAFRLFQQGAKEQALEFFFNRSRAGYWNHHHYMYDFDLLKMLLEKAGFAQIERMTFREGNVPDIDILDNRPDETLFVEARK
ncbi:MAG TPA: methyltransferase domain-containing protein [Nitrospiria bacterium]|nr:methyltransferase domain-containing protein [Nitrospiria bacterium]